MRNSSLTFSFRNPLAGTQLALPTRIWAMFLLLLLLSSSPALRTTITTTSGFIVSPSVQHPHSTSSTISALPTTKSLSLSPSSPTSTATTTATATTTTALASTKVVAREVYSSADLESSWDDSTNEAAGLNARGDTQIIGSPDHPEIVHPVLRALHDRKRRRQRQAQQQQQQQAAESDSNDSKDDDDDDDDDDESKKIALVIEGGGMRGCVTAGMVCAIDYLGLRDSVDVVYGSSAGSIIGAYFVTGQLPWFGPEVYYDQLTTAGRSFIDTGRLMRSLGLGILNPKLIRDVITRRNSGKPVLDLDFLLKETMQRTKPLDWKTFRDKQQQTTTTTTTTTTKSSSGGGQRPQPLRIVASGLGREEPLVMEYGPDHHFESLEELARCMHASALLPGIAGPVVNLLVNDEARGQKPRFVVRNRLKDDDYEPLADALVYAPIPYEAALADGATHMVVLRSKPDGGDVIGKGGNVGEKLVWSRFFLRKNKLPRIYRRLRNQIHKKLYAKSVLELNEAATGTGPLPPTLTVAISPEIPEIARLEVGREAIFEGVRDGFARAYDALVEDPSERGRGKEVARIYFPDEILDYSPPEMLALQQQQNPSSSSSSSNQQQQQQHQHQPSAFETYLETTGIWPKAWEGLTKPPMGHSSDRARVTRSGTTTTTTTAEADMATSTNGVQ